MYRFKTFEENEVRLYEFNSYQEARLWVEQQIEKFKTTNCVRDEIKDVTFQAFKRSLEDALNIQKGQQGASDMDDYLKCKKCSHEQHECVNFCRCESRNMRIAKEIRARGESSWKKSQPERLTPEDHFVGVNKMVCDSPNSENK